MRRVSDLEEPREGFFVAMVEVTMTKATKTRTSSRREFLLKSLGAAGALLGGLKAAAAVAPEPAVRVRRSAGTIDTVFEPMPASRRRSRKS